MPTLYDLPSQRHVPVAVRDEAATRLGNVVLNGGKAYFDSQADAFVMPTLAGTAAFLLAIGPDGQNAELRWETATRPQPQPTLDQSGLLEIVTLSPRQLELRRADGLVVARHQVSGLDSNLRVLEIRISAAGDFAAYRIEGTRAGSFTFGPEGYVVGLRQPGQPQWVGTRVYSPFCWHPNGGSVFAFAVDPEGRRAVFEWEIGRNPS